MIDPYTQNIFSASSLILLNRLASTFRYTVPSYLFRASTKFDKISSRCASKSLPTTSIMPLLYEESN